MPRKSPGPIPSLGLSDSSYPRFSAGISGYRAPLPFAVKQRSETALSASAGGCRRVSPGKRVVGIALLNLVPFYNFRAIKFNANTVLTPLWRWRRGGSMAPTTADHIITEYQLFGLDRGTLGPAEAKCAVSSAQCFLNDDATRCPCHMYLTCALA